VAGNPHRGPRSEKTGHQETGETMHCFQKVHGLAARNFIRGKNTCDWGERDEKREGNEERKGGSKSHGSPCLDLPEVPRKVWGEKKKVKGKKGVDLKTQPNGRRPGRGDLIT